MNDNFWKNSQKITVFSKNENNLQNFENLKDEEIRNLEIKEILEKSIYDVIEDFLLEKKSLQTRRAYRTDLYSFFNFVWVIIFKELYNIPLIKLWKNVVMFLDKYKKIDGYDKNRILNPKSINRKQYAISSFFEYLVRYDLFSKNPVRWIESLEVEKQSNTESLERAEIIDMIVYVKEEFSTNKDVKTLRNYLIISILFGLALRRNELVNLRWMDIDSSKNSINVFQKWWKIKKLPIPTKILYNLYEYKKLKWDECDYIFSPIRNNRTKEINKPLNVSFIFELVQKVASKCSIHKKITPHSLRKTFIEIALSNKKDFIEIINATGHSNIEMVNYYDWRNKLQVNAINDVYDGMF